MDLYTVRNNIMKGIPLQELNLRVCFYARVSTEKDEQINFKKGDVILIEKKEVYYWDGNCKIIMICTPAWYKEQCKLLEK